MNIHLKRILITGLLVTVFTPLSGAIESSSKEEDALKKTQGCEMAFKISKGSKTPGQMTAEESISYNYLKTVDSEKFQLCSRNMDGKTMPRSTSQVDPYPYQGRVSYIAEGNILALQTGQKITLLGIRILDGKNAEAKDYLKNMLVNHEVEVRYDIEKKDRYNRLQGYAYLGNTFINRALIEAGFAEAQSMPPNTSRDTILNRPLKEPELPASGEGEQDSEKMMRELQDRQFRMIYMMWGGMAVALVVGIILRKRFRR